MLVSRKVPLLKYSVPSIWSLIVRQNVWRKKTVLFTGHVMKFRVQQRQFIRATLLSGWVGSEGCRGQWEEVGVAKGRVGFAVGVWSALFRG